MYRLLYAAMLAYLWRIRQGSYLVRAMRLVALCTIYSSWLLASCWLPMSESERLLQQAKAGLDQTVSTIPRYEQFDLIHQSEALFSSRISDWEDGPCKYAEEVWVYGVDIQPTDVLAQYYQDLSEQGWSTKDTLSPTIWSSVFERDRQERIVIETVTSTDGEPGAFIQGIIGFGKEVTKHYITFVVVRVDYVVPQLEGC